MRSLPQFGLRANVENQVPALDNSHRARVEVDVEIEAGVFWRLRQAKLSPRLGDLAPGSLQGTRDGAMSGTV